MLYMHQVDYSLYREYVSYFIFFKDPRQFFGEDVLEASGVNRLNTELFTLFPRLGTKTGTYSSNSKLHDMLIEGTQ